MFILPGYTLVRTFDLPTSGTIEKWFYSMSLSVAIAPVLGLVLDATVGFNTVSVLVSLLIVDGWGLILVIGRIPRVLRLGPDFLNQVVRLVASNGRFILGVIAACLLTIFNWVSALGTHPIDMGAHVFWAKTIMNTGHIPDYAIVEPLDQAVKFTYGSHLLLAQFFLLSPIPIEEYYWVLPLIGSVGLWVAVLLLTFQITSSKWGSILAATLFGTAYHSGGYIQRGNLPDIIGYLLLVSVLYTTLRVRNASNFSFSLGLMSISVIPYHQLATVVLPTVLLTWMALSYVRSRTELAKTLRNVVSGRRHILFWTGMVVLAGILAGSVTYVNSSALSQLASSGWRPFVAPVYEDIFVPGIFLGVLGTAGLVVSARFRTIRHAVLLSWVVALVFLANALIIGIPVPDPQRFLWRLTEPFSIAAGVIFVEIAKRVPVSQGSILRSLIHHKGGRVNLPLLAIILFLILSSLHVSTVVSPAPRYGRAESFYEDDVSIGKWLANNSTANVVVLNDVDFDETATWVQVYSMRVHFIYKISYASIVAPANYVQIYRDTEFLYLYPNSTATLQIINRYDISYVIAHASQIPLFQSSQYFTPTYRVGESALFETKRE